jgi:RNA polymerase sigma-70 factor (ECF subfamily)
MTHSRDEVRLMITAAQKAEPGAVERLLEVYRHYLRFVARTCLTSALAGKADASDVVQETLLKAHQNFLSFRGSSEREFAAWLRQILAQNVAQLVRHFRSAGRDAERERSIEDLVSRSSNVFAGIAAASGTSPSMAAERRDTGVVLAAAMEELSDDQREIIFLRHVEELSWAEIAVRMNRSQDSARMLWARALKKLRPLIEDKLS